MNLLYHALGFFSTQRAPYTEVPADPELLREEIDWLLCAEPVFSFLRNVLTEPHQLIFLGDHRGHVLLACGGHKAMARAEKLCGIPGGEWGEEKVGCTILGTSLYTGTPVQVRWQENYCLNWKDWINHSAPIRAPLTQEILGALGIAGYRELSHPRALDLVIKAAEMIETAIREQETKARLLVLEHFTRLTTRYPSEGLLAIDKRGYILAANLIAEKILSLPHSHIIGRRVHDVPPLQEHLGQLVTVTPTQPKQRRILSGLPCFDLTVFHT
jgi:transcriptional regulator of acetoin/glycerol metabolism